MQAFISFQDIYFGGINTVLRATSLKQWLFLGLSREKRHGIPILNGVTLNVQQAELEGILVHNRSRKRSLLEGDREYLSEVAENTVYHGKIFFLFRSNFKLKL